MCLVPEMKSTIVMIISSTCYYEYEYILWIWIFMNTYNPYFLFSFTLLLYNIRYTKFIPYYLSISFTS